jgi:hypothetical protein
MLSEVRRFFGSVFTFQDQKRRRSCSAGFQPAFFFTSRRAKVERAARMAALQERRGGWRTSSQVWVPGTACCAPTKAKAKAAHVGLGRMANK